MSENVNYGLIGCGMMGQEHLRNIALLPNTRVAAIFEPNQIMADAAKATAPNAKLCGSLSDLLAEDLDVVALVLERLVGAEHARGVGHLRLPQAEVERHAEDVARLAGDVDRVVRTVLDRELQATTTTTT